MIFKRCASGKHLWLFPWQEHQRCVLCGKLRSLGVGAESISMSPAGVGDILRWSGSQDPLAKGDVGMDVATGLLRLWTTAAKNVLVEDGTVPGLPELNGVHRVTGSTTVKYATITAALAAASSGDEIFVGPGSYAESFTIPAGVSVVAHGGPEVTTITGTAATGTRVTLNNDTMFQGFLVELPTDATPAIAAAHTGMAYIKDCQLEGKGVNGIGLRMSGTGKLNVRNTMYRVGDCDIVFDLTGGFTIFWDCLIDPAAGGTVNIGWQVVGAQLGLANIGAFSSSIGTGVLVGANGFLLTGNLELQDMNIGIRATAATSQLHLRSTRIDNTGTWDILVDDPAAANCILEFHSGEFARNKISLPSSVPNAVLFFYDDRAGDKGMCCYGEMAVGRPGDGKELIVGEGDSYVENMYVFRNTNGEAGVWSDISAAMRSGTGSTAQIFPGTAANNAVYIGAPIPFLGVKTLTTIALALGTGNIDWEYWNGATWVEFTKMASDANSPYNQYAQTPFERAQSDQVRFDYIDTAGAAWATKSLNGQTSYWVRGIITSAITTIPTVEQLKIHTNRFEANADGFTEKFGNAEVRRDLLMHQELAVPAPGGGAPGSTNLTLTTNISLGPLNNTFTDNSFDQRGAMVEIPRGLDTSKDLKFEIEWYPATANTGNVEWTFIHGPIQVGDTLNGTLTDTTLTTIETIAAPANQVLRRTTFTFKEADVLPGEFVAFLLGRDATPGNPNDTLAGNVVITGMRMTGIFWQ